MEITELPTKPQKEQTKEHPKIDPRKPLYTTKSQAPTMVKLQKEIKLPKHWVPNVSSNKIDAKYSPREPTSE
jgi:hypothetical protein